MRFRPPSARPGPAWLVARTGPEKPCSARGRLHLGVQLELGVLDDPGLGEGGGAVQALLAVVDRVRGARQPQLLAALLGDLADRRVLGEEIAVEQDPLLTGPVDDPDPGDGLEGTR